MNGAQYLIKALIREGVDVVFGYPGGAIMPVYDALYGANIRHILTRHEQGAALAADGYARATGRVGVCMATSGPGATNLVTGIANAYMDSIPMVAITGQVPLPMMGTDAFQEVDIFGITLPIVKHSFLVRKVEDLPHVVRDAFRIARSGRPGPVLIDFPKDIANAVAPDHFPSGENDAEIPPPSEEALTFAAQLLSQSKQPLLYAGGGIGIARAIPEFRTLVEKSGIPVVSTLKGLGAIPTDHAQFLGMLGMHGSKAANFAVQSCDLLICVGARFDDRATGKLSEFAPNAKVIHYDVDPAEVSKLRHADAPVLGNLRTALSDLANRCTLTHKRISHWQQECYANKKQYTWDYNAPTDFVYAPAFLKELSERAGDNTIFTCDVGQHQMWVAQHCQFRHPSQHLTSGGLGTMGYGLPAAIGAQIGCPQARVINVTGDGSVMMNIQELATIKRFQLPVKIVLFDNQTLGMVRQWQELFFEERYSETDLSDNPDFVKVAEAFGMPAIRVDHKSQVPGAIDRILSTPGPLFVHVIIDRQANVWPLVPPGKSNTQMIDGNDDLI